MRKFILTTISALGLVVVFFGYLLPQRLPRSQQDMGKEGISAVVGAALLLLPYLLNRRKENQ
jgi:hypothetical protein